jgi:hypothetical protein
LDKIIDRSIVQAPPPVPQQAPRRDDYDQYGGHRKEKRGGFLENLFDF